MPDAMVEKDVRWSYGEKHLNFCIMGEGGLQREGDLR